MILSVTWYCPSVGCTALWRMSRTPERAAALLRSNPTIIATVNKAIAGVKEDDETKAALGWARNLLKCFPDEVQHAAPPLPQSIVPQHIGPQNIGSPAADKLKASVELVPGNAETGNAETGNAETVAAANVESEPVELGLGEEPCSKRAKK